MPKTNLSGNYKLTFKDLIASNLEEYINVASALREGSEFFNNVTKIIKLTKSSLYSNRNAQTEWQNFLEQTAFSK